MIIATFIIQVAALRFYSSHSFPAINSPLRDQDRVVPHPLAAITMCIATGLKKLRSFDATSNAATSEIVLWRGFTDMKVNEEFKAKGGTEIAPMSTTSEPRGELHVCV